MAVYKLFPSQDATIYSRYPNKNTGLDEILSINIEDAQSSGMDWELESLDKGRQPEMAGASGMGTTSGDLLKAYLTSGQ
jgi:hypothetical protein